MGQKLADEPASPWFGVLNWRELSRVRRCVHRGGPIRPELKPVIMRAVLRTCMRSEPLKSIFAANVLIDMNGADLATLHQPKD